MINPCCDLVGAGKEGAVVTHRPQWVWQVCLSCCSEKALNMQNCPDLGLTSHISLKHSLFSSYTLHLSEITFPVRKAAFIMHQYFVYKHNLPFFSVMYSISHKFCFHIKEAHTIIRILTLVRNPRCFWYEQEVVMSTSEFLVFYCPKQPLEHCKSDSTAVHDWPSPGKKNFGITYLLGNSTGNLLLFVYSPRLEHNCVLRFGQ